MEYKENFVKKVDNQKLIENFGAYFDGCIKNHSLVSNTINGFKYVVDYFLPSQNSLLSTPANTIIEFKRILQSDTIFRSRKYFDLFQKEGQVKHWIVVYVNEDKIPSSILDFYKTTDFIIINIQSLYDDLKHKGIDLFRPSYQLKWENQSTEHLKCLHDVCSDKHVSLFLGAGVGVDAGMPSWDCLLEQLFNKTDAPRIVENTDEYKALVSTCKNSALIIGRCVFDSFHNDEMLFRNSIREILYADVKNSALVKNIASLVKRNTISSIITYNYDDLIEAELDKVDYAYLPVYQNNRCSVGEMPIYHVHGFVPRDKRLESMPILGELQYHQLYKEAFHWSNVEQLHALSRNCCVFIGLSMVDPNLRRLMDIARMGSEGDAPHYLFQIRKCDFVGEKAELYFEKYEHMMGEFGINIIWYKEHTDLPNLLDQV